MEDFTQALAAIASYIRDNLGPSIVLPVVIIILGLILRQKFSQALRAGILIGIGFIGINLVIGLMGEVVGPAATAMVQNSGIELGIVDVGWPSSAAIAFGSMIGPLIIPVGIVVNLLLLVFGLTRTLNIDIWNFWHSALAGALVAAVVGDLWIGLAAAAVHMIVVLALADLSAPVAQKYFNLPDISFPHGTSAPYVVLAAPLNWLFDRIPGFNKLNADPQSIQKRFGIFGESLMMGFIIGIVLGIPAFLWQDGEFAPLLDSIPRILILGVTLAAVFLLLPRMVSVLMEGLIPVSDSAREFIQKRFPGRKFYIGLDSAIAVGNPAVLATSLLLVPITLLTAVALAPVGNQVLPLVDLATIPFIVALMVPFFRGNIIRSVIGGAIVIGLGLFIATWTAVDFTNIAKESGFAVGDGQTISSLVDGANPLTGLFFALSNLGSWTVAVLAVLALGLAFWVSRIEKKRDIVRAAEEAKAAEAAE